MAPRASQHARLTPAEVDHLSYSLEIAITQAEDLGMRNDLARLQMIYDTLDKYHFITAQDQIFLGQFYDL